MASSKLRDAHCDTESDCTLDMSPMIDMVFLLLIFFIVNATVIVVKADPKVRPPIADNALPQKEASGRIVINIRNDGSCTGENFNQPLIGEDAVYELVKSQHDRHQQQGVISRLHLRGDRDAVFKHCRSVIRAAAKAGVDQVIFGVYVRQP